MSQPTLPKRFYETVSLEEKDEGFAILLDGRGVSTPARAELLSQNKALAEQIASEWEAQTEKIDPSTMPATTRLNTALDRVRGREDAVIDDIVSYAGTDLLCYRAEMPEGLVELQQRHWDPVLEWIKTKHGATFETQAGISHVEQPEASLAKIRDLLARHDHLALTPLHTLTTLTGSALLVLAIVEGHLESDTAWVAAHVDEDWQISQWGEDAEAKARRTRRRAEFDADCRFLALLKP